MNRNHLVVLAFIPLFLSGCGSESPSKAKPPPASPPASAPAASPAASRVLLVPGVLRADELVDLYAKTSGYIADLPVDIGYRVKKDSLLLRISVPELDAQLANSEATLVANRAKAEQARSMVESARAEESRSAAEANLQRLTFKRREDLFKQQAIPQQEWDEAHMRLDASEALLKSAQAKIVSAEAESHVADAQVNVAEARRAEIRSLLDYSRIVAPFDGVITRRFMDPGAFVRSASQGASSPLLTIAKTDPLRLVLDIPEDDAPHIHIGDELEFTVRGMGEMKFRARISRTAQGLRADTRTMQAEADIPNADNRFLPGAYAQAILFVASSPASQPAREASR